MFSFVCSLKLNPLNKHPHFAFFLSFFIATSALSQADFVYVPFVSSGNIPDDFLILSSEKFKEEKTKIEKNNKRSVRKAKEQFYLKSSYYVDELLLSGKVTFNDPASIYAKKVLQKVLENDPGLFKQFRLYTVQSTAVNAITTDNGIIFITTGLIAQLENEAQLAYILAHEVIHFKNKHAVNAFLENEQIEEGKGDYRRKSNEDRILAKSAYSKELETEADEQGLDLYLKTNYSLDVLNGVFDVLQYAYLPFDDVPFNTNFFESEYLHFPSEYLLDKIADITGEEDYNDSKSTHPNILKRRKKISSKIEGISNEGKKKFIISEVEFLNIRETARFELCQLYVSSRDYGNAIYSCYLLLLSHPDNAFLKKTISKALYGIAKYKNLSSGGVVIKNYEKVEGHSQQLFYLLKKIKPEEFNSVALSYIWKQHHKYPEDKFLKNISSDLMKDLVYEHKLKPADFHKKQKEILKMESEEKDSKDLSKYEKIKKKKGKDQVEGEDYYFKYSFVDVFSDRDFSSSFEDLFEKFTKEQEENEKELTKKEKREKEKAENREKKLISKKGYALGIDKIVVVDPYYKVLDLRKKDAVKLIVSENSQKKFSEIISANSSMAGLHADILDSKNLQSGDAEKFNDLMFLNDWVSEHYAHDDLKIKNSRTEDMDKLISKYGTKYFAWTGIITARERNSNAGYYVCLSLMLPYFLPFTLIYALTPKYDTMYYMILFDVETGEPVLFDKYYFNFRDRDDILNSYIFNSCFQIKNKRNKK